MNCLDFNVPGVKEDVKNISELLNMPEDNVIVAIQYLNIDLAKVFTDNTKTAINAEVKEKILSFLNGSIDLTNKEDEEQYNKVVRKINDYRKNPLITVYFNDQDRIKAPFFEAIIQTLKAVEGIEDPRKFFYKDGNNGWALKKPATTKKQKKMTPLQRALYYVNEVWTNILIEDKEQFGVNNRDLVKKALQAQGKENQDGQPSRYNYRTASNIEGKTSDTLKNNVSRPITALGNMVDEVLRDIIPEIKKGTDVTPAWIRRNSKAYSTEEGDGVGKLSNSNLEVLIEYANKIIEDIDPKRNKHFFTHPIFLSAMFSVSREFNNGIVSGVPDLIVVDNDGNFEVYDFKVKQDITAFNDVKDLGGELNRKNWSQIHAYSQMIESFGFKVTKKELIPIIGTVEDSVTRTTPGGRNVTYKIVNQNGNKLLAMGDGKTIEANKLDDVIKITPPSGIANLKLSSNRGEQSLFSLVDPVKREAWLKLAEQKYKDFKKIEGLYTEEDILSDTGEEERPEIPDVISKEERERLQESTSGSWSALPSNIRKHLSETLMRDTTLTIDSLMSFNGQQLLRLLESIDPNLRNIDLDTFKTKTREEVIKTVGIEKILKYRTSKLVSTLQRSGHRAATAIQKDYNNFLLEGYRELLRLENVAIKLVGNKITTTTNENTEGLDEEALKAIEAEENMREHWSVDPSHISATSSLAKEINRMLSLLEDGVNEETGVIQFADYSTVSSTLFKWLSKCNTYDEMIEVLESKEGVADWVSSLLNKLDLGEESLRSKFFSNFRKQICVFTKIKVSRNVDGSYSYERINLNTLSSYEAIRQAVENSYDTGTIPLFEGQREKGKARVSKTELGKLQVKLNSIRSKYSPNIDADDLDRLLSDNVFISDLYDILYAIGFKVTPEEVEQAIFEGSGQTIIQKLGGILRNFDNAASSGVPYSPFDRSNPNSSIGYFKDLVAIFSTIVEDTIEASVYEDGKTYYAFQNPSKISNLIRDLSNDNLAERREFIESEYGKSSFFKDKQGNYRIAWLQDALKGGDALELATQLSFNRIQYRDLGPIGYPLSVMAEFFSDPTGKTARYVTPIYGNKPASDFIKAKRYNGKRYQEDLAQRFFNVIEQEILRITEVLDRRTREEARIDHYDIKDSDFNKLPATSRQELVSAIRDKRITPALLQKHKALFLNSGASFKFFDAFNSVLFNTQTSDELKGFQNLIIEQLNGKPNSKFPQEMIRALKTMVMPDIVKEELENYKNLGLLRVDKGSVGYQFPLYKRKKGGELVSANSKVTRYIKGINKYKYLGSFIDVQESVNEAMKDPSISGYVNDLYVTQEGQEFKLQYSGNNESVEEVLDKITAKINEKIEEAVTDALTNYIWNSYYASINIIELTVTDLAFFKNMNDFQKRFAMLHSPGIRLNKDAQWQNKPVSDGKYRMLHVKDRDIQFSKDKVRSVLDDSVTSVIGQLKQSASPSDVAKINSIEKVIKAGLNQQFSATDGQTWVTPSGYRKKMIMLGRWTEKEERAYNKIIEGDFNVSDLEILMQPLKPIIMTTMMKSSAQSSKMVNTRVPMVVKDSETCLFLAAVLMKGSRATNKYAALYDFMEETHRVGRKVDSTGKVIDKGEYVVDGIDSISYGSTSKFGSSGVVDINEDAIAAYKAKHGSYLTDYDATMGILREAARGIDGSSDRWNTGVVNTFSFDDFAIQQEVPTHLQDNDHQVIGSQFRILNISGFSPETKIRVRTKDSSGGYVFKEHTAKEIYDEYTELSALNIQDSIKKLKKELAINSIKGDPTGEENLRLSKILRENILKDAKWGYDLYRACSVEKVNGRWEFVIPLSDPMHGNRVAQLIHSILKKRVNKQQVNGGSVVQATYLSDDLNIRFEDKNGNLLPSWDEYKNKNTSASIDDYKNYLKVNSARLAYWEVYTVCPSKKLEDTLVNAALIEGKAADYYMVNLDEAVSKGIILEEQLKAIGYRIPTEDKYSMAPMKIKGFLSRAAGEVLFMPKEITLLTGSDFDIDKMYVIFKDFEYKEKFRVNGVDLSKGQVGKIKNEARRLYPNYFKVIDHFKEEDFTDDELKAIWQIIYEEIPGLKKWLKEKREASREWEEVEITDKTGQKKYVKDYKRSLNWYINHGDTTWNTIMLGVANAFASELVESGEESELEFKTLDEFKDYIFSRVAIIKKPDFEGGKAVKEGVLIFNEEELKKDGISKNQVFKKAAQNLGIATSNKEIIERSFTEIDSSDTREGRNNRLFDLSWAALTAPESALQSFNPGGFNEAKRVARIITIAKNLKKPDGSKYTREELSGLSLKQLEDMLSGDAQYHIAKPSTQFYFHRQNMVAAKLIGIFANHNVSHAFLEHRNINWVIGKLEKDVLINGSGFDGKRLDALYDLANTGRVGRNIAEFLAASVDAVKDPVLNFFNMNTVTASSAMTMIRTGHSIETVGLFMSQPILVELSRRYSEEEEDTGKTYVNSVIETLASELVSNYKLDRASAETSIYSKDKSLTDSSLYEGLNTNLESMTQEQALEQLKVLLAFKKINALSNELEDLTYITKFNSVNNAAGPNIEDILAQRARVDRFFNKFMTGTSAFSEEAGSLLSPEGDKLLYAFYKDTVGYGLLDSILKNHFIAFTSTFNDVFMEFTQNSKFTPSAKTIKKLLGDFTTYIMTMTLPNGSPAVFDFSEEKRKELINNFPMKLVKWQSQLRAKGIKNVFLDSLILQAENKWCPVPTIKQRTDLLQGQIRWEEYKGAFADLLSITRNPEDVFDLVRYTTLRGGMNFAPCSFAHLIPVDVKLGFPNYIARLRESLTGNIPVTSIDFLDQFRRNNWKDPAIVPIISKGLLQKGGLSVISEEDGKIEFSVRRDKNNNGIVINEYQASKDDAANQVPFIRYNGKLYRILSDNATFFIDSMSYGVRYEEVSTLGIPNNFLEYDGNENYRNMETVFEGEDLLKYASIYDAEDTEGKDNDSDPNQKDEAQSSAGSLDPSKIKDEVLKAVGINPNLEVKKEVESRIRAILKKTEGELDAQSNMVIGLITQRVEEEKKKYCP